MAAKKPSAKQLAARKLFAQRAKAGAFAKKRKSNPLSRVKKTSPSMTTGKAPSARLKKRRAATAKAPKGYYANPKTRRVFEVYTASGTYVCTCATKKLATEVAQALANETGSAYGVK